MIEHDTQTPARPGRPWWAAGALWERIGTGLLATGLFMLMQPWSLALFSHSFTVVLAGVVLFSIAVKLPRD